VLIVTRDDLSRPAVAVTLVAVAAATTATLTVLLRRAPAVLLDWRVVVAELVVAGALLAGDRVAYGGPHSQSLGSAWPIASLLATGVALGPVGGIVAALALGAAQAAGATKTAGLSLVSTTVLYAFAGGVAGFVSTRLQRAEQEVATARAREEVARTLHDGVLQILAVVQRRSTEPDLVRLARDQERELREYLFGTLAVESAGRGGDLGAALRAAAARFEDRHGGRASVVVADDVPRLSSTVVDALAGAVGEALTNAAKHGHATRATVFAEPDDRGGVFCSVKDDGQGFDAGAVGEGVGIRSSIRGRLEDVGGTVEIDGNAGHGTEVRLWAR
jgi:signal transduction histidine kinase